MQYPEGWGAESSAKEALTPLIVSVSFSTHDKTDVVEDSFGEKVARMTHLNDREILECICVTPGKRKHNALALVEATTDPAHIPGPGGLGGHTAALVYRAPPKGAKMNAYLFVGAKALEEANSAKPYGMSFLEPELIVLVKNHVVARRFTPDPKDKQLATKKPQQPEERVESMAPEGIRRGYRDWNNY